MNQWMLCMAVTSAEVKNVAVPKKPGLLGRLLFQVDSPEKPGEDATTFFTWDLPKKTSLDARDLDTIVRGGVIVKQRIIEAFEEGIAPIKVHFLQDIQRDWFQKIIGTSFTAAASTLLGAVSVGPIKLGALLKAEDGLKLGDKKYSQKLGHTEIPVKLQDGWTLERSFDLVARADAAILEVKPPDPVNLPPVMTKVVATGATSMALGVKVSVARL
jgi:hypothetical protein